MKELTNEEIEKAYSEWPMTKHKPSWTEGAKFARDRQKEIDREEIERLKECLRGFIRIRSIFEYSGTIDSCYEGEALAVNNALKEAERLTKA